MDEENIKFFNDCKEKAQDAIDHFDAKEARDLIREMDFYLKKISEGYGNNKEQIEECSALLVRLRLLALPPLKDEEIKRFIKESTIKALNDPELSLAERVGVRQLVFPRSTRLEMVNQPINEALHKNEEKIGANKIFISGQNTAVTPTVANWILDYDRTYGTGAQKDLTWLEYVKKSAFGARLNSQETETLRKLLKFYEFLKREYTIE